MSNDSKRPTQNLQRLNRFIRKRSKLVPNNSLRPLVASYTLPWSLPILSFLSLCACAPAPLRPNLSCPQMVAPAPEALAIRPPYSDQWLTEAQTLGWTSLPPPRLSSDAPTLK